MKFIITAYNPNIGKFNKARMMLQLQPFTGNYDTYCLMEMQKLCFWENASYEVTENINNSTIFQPQKIGEFASKGLQILCPQYQFDYQFTSPNNYLAIINQTLYTKMNLDHDSFQPGPNINANVKCTIRMGANSIFKEFQKVINITVLDRNDNRPEFQEKSKLTFWLENPHYNEVSPV